MIIYNNNDNNTPIYNNMRCGRRRDENIVNGRRLTSPPLSCVCVCNNYDLRDGNPDAVAAAVAAKESRSRFDFGRRAADRFSTIYLFIFFPTMYVQ